MLERHDALREGRMMLDTIVAELSESLKNRVLVAFGHVVERVVLQVPPKLSMGDLATPLPLELAKALKKPPRQVAESILNGLELPPLVRSVSIEGPGYLNFRFDRGAFTAEQLRTGLVPPQGSSRESVIVEHTNINPNKAAHIGHLRNAVLGDTLVRCLTWLGHRVETQNYIDDTGVQVADVVVGFERMLGEGEEQIRARIEDESSRFDYVCWDLYSKVTGHYAADPEARKWQGETLHRIEKREGETARIAGLIAEAIVRHHLQTMLRLDIRYDLLPKESDILNLQFWHQAFDLLKASGAVVYATSGKSKGCWVMKLADAEGFEGMEEPDKILVRSNGTVTYVGKDIAYQLWKFGLLGRTFNYRRFLSYEGDQTVWETTSEPGDAGAPEFGGADRVFNVIDSRQAYLQRVVKEGLRLLGHAPEAGRSIHFSYEMVALTPATAAALGMTLSAEDAEKQYVEMSGRKGLGVKADDMLDALEAKSLESLRARLGSGEATEHSLQPEEFPQLARDISVGALRYFMLKYGRNKVIAFDFQEALSFEGDSGPYLQYSTVRARNIFKKMADRGVSSGLEDRGGDVLTIDQGIADEIWEIVRLCAETPAVIRRSVEVLELSQITHHALELAQKFNSFYHRFPILSEADPSERRRRAACAEISQATLAMLLRILAIPLPAKM